MAELKHTYDCDMLTQISEHWFEVKYAIPGYEVLTNKARQLKPRIKKEHKSQKTV
jgi:hypothetical protein